MNYPLLLDCVTLPRQHATLTLTERVTPDHEHRARGSHHEPTPNRHAGAGSQCCAAGTMFGVTPRAVDTGVIAGQTVVTEGLHVCYEEAYRG